MRTVHPTNLFRWTLWGKCYFILAAGGMALLALLMGVM